MLCAPIKIYVTSEDEESGIEIWPTDNLKVAEATNNCDKPRGTQKTAYKDLENEFNILDSDDDVFDDEGKRLLLSSIKHQFW